MGRLSKRSLEGEIFIDHSASPGVTQAEIGDFGLAVPKGDIYESAIYTCSHCQCMVVINPQRSRERGWCSKCDKYICDECAYRLNVTLQCEVIQRTIDQLYERFVIRTDDTRESEVGLCEIAVNPLLNNHQER